MNLERILSVGLHIPAFSAGALPTATDYTQFFRASEALGFDALWAEDRILHPTPLLEPLQLLGWAAANTEHMVLGTAVMALNLRRAAVVARQVATLAHLSSDRLVLGVSVGGSPSEYTALEVPMNHRVGVFRDSVHVLRELLRGKALDHSSQVGSSSAVYDNAVVRPAAEVPILIGGAVDAAVARAGELGDGWIMAPFGDLSEFKSKWERVLESAVRANRDADQLIAGRLLYVCVDDDPDRARTELNNFLKTYYGDRMDVDAHGIFGCANKVADQLCAQIEAGITHLMLGVPTLDIEHIERLATDVMPSLRATAG
jgi:alkanesulfonate monooxygenase SsuD/methylene tetrahydromethanopterin reductase-like flavin-dependent oxidoreductase (luciferase family)